MINKLKSKKGSALQVAIICILLVGTCSAVVTNMVVNQIKSTHRKTENLNAKYDTEEYVEEVIGNFIDGINAEGVKVNKLKVDMGIIEAYLDLADILVGSNGALNDDIKIIIDRINKNIQDKTPVAQKDIDDLNKHYTEAITGYGKSNPHAQQMIYMAKDYSDFIFTEMLNEKNIITVEKLNLQKCNKFIAIIKSNLSEDEIDTDSEFEPEIAISRKNENNGNNGNSGNNGNNGGGNKADPEYGMIALAYRDLLINEESKDSLLKVLNTSFNKDNGPIYTTLKTLNDLSEESQIKEWLNTNSENLIKQIEGTNYKGIIQQEKNLIGDSGYLKVQEIKKLYKTTGNPNFNEIVSERLDIIEKEIDMLIAWMNFMQGLGSSNPGETITSEDITISIPKKITLNYDGNTLGEAKSIIINNERSKDVQQLEGDTNYYKYKILEGAPKIIIELDILGVSGDYKTESKVEFEIHTIKTSKDYKIDYRINDWKKA